MLEHFIDLPVDEIKFVSDIPPRLHFGHFYPVALRTFSLQQRDNAKVQFVLKPVLVSYFLCSDIMFYFLVPPRNYFLDIYPTAAFFLSTYTSI